MEKVRETQSGFLYTFVAFFWWGLFPLYWKLLVGVSSTEILASRIIWSFVLTFAIVLLKGEFHKFKSMLKEKETVFSLFMASTFVSINWGSYILAVNTGRVLEASLGQYLAPLIMALCGVAVFKEKLLNSQKLALVLASVGVLIIALRYGKFPWVSIVIASSFALYSVSKKQIKADAFMGLVLETAIISPFALMYITSISIHKTVTFGTSLSVSLLLIGAGVVTTVPLVLFAKSTQKLGLSSIIRTYQSPLS